MNFYRLITTSKVYLFLYVSNQIIMSWINFRDSHNAFKIKYCTTNDSDLFISPYAIPVRLASSFCVIPDSCPASIIACIKACSGCNASYSLLISISLSCSFKKSSNFLLITISTHTQIVIFISNCFICINTRCLLYHSNSPKRSYILPSIMTLSKFFKSLSRILCSACFIRLIAFLYLIMNLFCAHFSSINTLRCTW